MSVLGRPVVILGCGPRCMAPQPDAEVWAINKPREGMARWFHLHGPEHVAWAGGQDAASKLKNEASAGHVRVVMPAAYFPGVEAFPYEALRREFRRGLYLTHSVPALLALAIYECAVAITIDGVHHGNGGRAEDWSVPCIAYWIGLAEGRGIPVYVAPGTGLVDYTHTYGLEGPGAV